MGLYILVSGNRTEGRRGFIFVSTSKNGYEEDVMGTGSCQSN
jgi:hypothetical protein